MNHPEISSGIKRSYRHDKETRTVVMPVLIALLIGGLAAFHYKTKPESDRADAPAFPAPAGFADTGGDAPASADSPGSPPSAHDDGAPLLRAVPVGLEPGAEEAAAAPPGGAGAPRAGDPPAGGAAADESAFTPWMSPLALDSYIRAKNHGHSESFWKRGHWITAVEGRWHDGGLQFRIAYSGIPDPEAWAWQYRANQTREQFARSLDELAAAGYTLVQSQRFDRPDDTARYQGVWQRRAGEAPSLAQGDGPAPEAPEAAEEP